jgi:hypothetical protein
MGINFPTAPAIGTLHPNPAVSGVPQYTWDGEKWVSGTGGGAIYISDTAPTAPVGSLWWESDTGILYVRYYDGSSTQWVAIAGGDVSVTKSYVDAGDAANAAAITAGDANTLKYTAQTLTEAERTQARTNIYAAPMDALAYSGMQINGGFEVSQELGSTGTGTNGAYACDGWLTAWNGTMAVSSLRYSAAPTLFSGLPNFLNVYAATAEPVLASTSYAVVLQSIEGHRIARLCWGTANARPITIGFWTCHVRAGTYGGVIRNSPITRSYAFSYTQNVASTSEYKVITIPGCTDGVWNINNTVGLQVVFAMAAGVGQVAPTANTWLTGSYLSVAGQVNNVAAANDTCRWAGLVVLPGIEAPSAERSPLIMRPFDQELVTCQRYFEPIGKGGLFGLTNATTGTIVHYTNKVTKRANPTLVSPAGSTITVYQPFTGSNFNSTATPSIGAIDPMGGTLNLPGFTGLTVEKIIFLTDHSMKLDARL